MALNVFMQQRDDPQIKVPAQLRLGDPTTYVFVTDNASDAETRGVELEASWQLAAHADAWVPRSACCTRKSATSICGPNSRAAIWRMRRATPSR